MIQFHFIQRLSEDIRYVFANSNTTSFLTIWSLMKWQLLLIRQAGECWIGLLDRLVELVSSHLIDTFLRIIHNSATDVFIHNTRTQRLPVATYSTSTVEIAMEVLSFSTCTIPLYFSWFFTHAFGQCGTYRLLTFLDGKKSKRVIMGTLINIYIYTSRAIKIKSDQKNCCRTSL